MKTRLIHPGFATVLLAALAAGIAFWVLIVPVRFIEPDDLAFFRAMQVFSLGKVVAGEDDLRTVTGRSGDGPVQLPGWLRNDRGFIFEKSPGYAFLLAMCHPLRLERLLNPALVFLSMLLMAVVLARPPGNRAFGVYAAILFGANPTLMILSSRTYMSDAASAAMVALGGLAFLAAETGGLRRYYAAAGLLLGFAVMVRYTNMIALMALPLYFSATGFIENRTVRGWLRRFSEPEIWLVCAGAFLPLLLQAIYNLVTTGSILTTGYTYRMREDGIPQFSLAYLGRNLLDETPGLFLGFPALVLYPLGIFALARRSPRAAAVSVLMFASFFGLYIFNAWARTDHFVFTARFYLPAAFGLALGGAAALEGSVSKAASYICIILIVGSSLLFAGDFARRYVLADRHMPRMGTLGGPMMPGGGPGMHFRDRPAGRMDDSGDPAHPGQGGPTGDPRDNPDAGQGEFPPPDAR